MQDSAQNITLAPAAGSGIGKLLFDALLARPDFIPLMVEAAIGGLSAESHFYSPAQKEVISKPDYRVRQQAVVMLLANAEGEPVKRIIHQHLGGDGLKTDVQAALRESPALQEAVERALANAKFRTRNVKTKPVERVGEVLPQSQ